MRESGPVQLADGERIDNLLVVNKDRVFMENVGAVQELSRMTETLEQRIKELESLNRDMRRRTLQRRSRSLDKEYLDIAPGGGNRRDGRRFPWLQMTAWLILVLLLAAVLSVGAVLLVSRQQKNGADGNSTNVASTPLPVFGGSTTAALLSTTTTAAILSTSGSSTLPTTTTTTTTTTTAAATTTTTTTTSVAIQCLDGSWRSAAALCPDRISFAFSNDFATISDVVSEYRDALTDRLADVMGVRSERIHDLQVSRTERKGSTGTMGWELKQSGWER